jgi:hypothetical protein
MFLGSYEFDGDPAELVPAYDRLMGSFPPDALILHVCTTRAGGLTVFDACPSREVFVGFSTGPDFAAACDAAGLPPARVVHHGEVHAAMLRDPVTP